MIFKKTINRFKSFIVFSILLASVILSSCSSGLSKPKYVSVSFEMDKAAVRQIVEQINPLRTAYRAADSEDDKDK